MMRPPFRRCPARQKLPEAVRTKELPGKRGQKQLLTTVRTKEPPGKQRQKRLPEAVRIKKPAEKQKIYARKINVYDTKKIGCIAKIVSGGIGEAVSASYTLKPDDLYVRARIVSPERPAASAFQHPKVHVAWTQPYVRA